MSFGLKRWNLLPFLKSDPSTAASDAPGILDPHGSALGPLRKAFWLLYAEGALAMAYEAWIGPTYLSALAGELNVPVIWVTLLSSAAWIGAVGQVAGVWAFERFSSEKTYTLWLAGIARALWVIPFLTAGVWGFLSLGAFGKAAQPFPVIEWFIVVSAVACVSALFSASSAASWSSWMKQIVPSPIRARFLGARHRFVMGAVLATHLITLSLIDFQWEGLRVGAFFLGFLALLCAGISTFLLAQVPGPAVPPQSTPSTQRTSQAASTQRSAFLKMVLTPLKNSEFRGVLLFGSAFNFAMQLGGYYFPYYFTNELKIPMSEVATWLAFANLSCVLSAGFWGKWIDQSSRPVAILRGSAFVVSLSPLFYLVPSVEWVRSIGRYEYFLNGLFWMGYYLCLTSLLFSRSPQSHTRTGRDVAIYFSVYSAIAGLGGALGAFLGGQIATWMQPWGGFRVLWLVATSTRLLVVFGSYFWLRERASHKQLSPPQSP